MGHKKQHKKKGKLAEALKRARAAKDKLVRRFGKTNMEIDIRLSPKGTTYNLHVTFSPLGCSNVRKVPKTINFIPVFAQAGGDKNCYPVNILSTDGYNRIKWGDTNRNHSRGR